MPDDFDDQSNDQNNDQTNTNWRRDLEAKARKADELAVEVETLKRDAVFSSALTGIDHPGLGYFKDGYKGDLTPEAIREAAVNAGFASADITPPPTPATPTPAAPDLAAHQRMAAASVGSAPPPPFDPHEAVAAAKSPEEVMAIVEAHGEKLGVISSRLAQ